MKPFLIRWAWPAAVLLPWLLTWWHLSAEWGADEQYRYAFGVPVLAAWMMRRRFPGPMKPWPTGLPWCGLVVLALVSLTLGEALVWHDPLWRLTGATLECGATLLCIAWLLRCGGTPLVRRQLFPLLFAALAVPWPVPVEIWTIHHLASAVTDVATSAANLFGIAAMQHGNTIELAACTVGVDDACSGIQSLQATLMTSFFLGEFFLLRAPGRIALIVSGAVISFVINCARVLSLTMLAHSQGHAGAMEWHDFIGGTATFCGFALLLGAAIFLSHRTAIAAPVPCDITPSRMPEGIAILMTVAAILAGTHGWFSRLEKSRAQPGSAPVWEIAADHLAPGWAVESVAPTKAARTMIRFSEWQSLTVRNPEGTTAQVIRLAWNASARMPPFVTTHTPAVCMPSAGWTQAGPAFLFTLELRGEEFPCTAFPFERDGTRLLALQSLSANGRPELRLMNPSPIPGTLGRLAKLWKEPLRQITEELLLYIPDPGDAEARKKSATEFLGAVLMPRTK